EIEVVAGDVAEIDKRFADLLYVVMIHGGDKGASASSGAPASFSVPAGSSGASATRSERRYTKFISPEAFRCGFRLLRPVLYRRSIQQIRAAARMVKRCC